MATVFSDIYEPIGHDALSRIPDILKGYKRWVVWGGNKIPVNGNHMNEDGFYVGANVTKPGAWVSFPDACKLIGKECNVNNEYFHVAGIGFVVGDGIFCLDMDGGEKHHKENVPEEAIREAMAQLKSYAETSISGCGYHVFGFSEALKIEEGQPVHFQPNNREDSYELEMFTRNKFIVLSGNSLS